jgi:hypothetical protein
MKPQIVKVAFTSKKMAESLVVALAQKKHRGIELKKDGDKYIVTYSLVRA